jgi:hypothetical protein
MQSSLSVIRCSNIRRPDAVLERFCWRDFTAGERQMRHVGFFAICGAAILLVLSAPAVAKDEGRGIGYAATGPIFDLPAGISVERLEVDVSLHSVRLNYVFKSARRQTVHFDFAMPEMPVDASPDAIGVAAGDKAAGFAADTRPANYLNLAVRVNDQPLTLTGHGHALLNGKDVTRQLRDAGVPLLYDFDGEAPWRRLSPQVQEMLKTGDLLQLDAALWHYQASFAWDQSFEYRETRVEMSYVPVFNYWSDITRDQFPEIEPGGSATKAYCINGALRRAFYRKAGYDLYTVTHKTPSSGWRGPISRYRLTVDKGAATNLVAFCPLSARKISPTTFEWTATNYTPSGQIGVLFFVDPDAAPANKRKRP